MPRRAGAKSPRARSPKARNAAPAGALGAAAAFALGLVSLAALGRRVWTRRHAALPSSTQKGNPNSAKESGETGIGNIVQPPGRANEEAENPVDATSRANKEAENPVDPTSRANEEAKKPVDPTLFNKRSPPRQKAGPNFTIRIAKEVDDISSDETILFVSHNKSVKVNNEIAPGLYAMEEFLDTTKKRDNYLINHHNKIYVVDLDRVETEKLEEILTDNKKYVYYSGEGDDREYSALNANVDKQVISQIALQLRKDDF